MQRPTVSVLLTGGIAEYFPDSYGVKNKALLPINGRRLFEYVLKALVDSRAEKVFVIQEADTHLESLGTRHEKVLYANCKSPNPDLADSLVCALETLLDFYGEYELQQRQIMFVPCDIPLVTSEDLNALMAQTSDSEVDCYLTLIKNEAVKAASSEHHFRLVYFEDLGGYYSLQGLVFVSGRLFRLGKPNDDSGRVAVFNRSSQPLSGLAEIIQDIRNKRSRLLGWLRFCNRLIFRRLVVKGHTGLLIQLVCSYLFHKLTISLLERAIYKALNVKLALVETRSEAFSADIDTPRDLEYIKRRLNVTQKNEGALNTQKEPVV